MERKRNKSLEVEGHPCLGKDEPFTHLSLNMVRAEGQSEDQEEIRLHCRGFKVATFGPHWPSCFLFSQHSDHTFLN